jgi:superfamily II DNA or RNA helicase
MSIPLTLRFDGGTLHLSGPPELLDSLPHCQFDQRTGVHRAEGRCYRPLVEFLRSKQIPYTDEARQYQPTPWQLRDTRRPFPHQQEAVELWWKESGRGIVVLPTGTGKTFVAILAIARAGRPAMIVAPTIVLMNQWHAELRGAFGVEVGLIGGGSYDLQPLTVTTYDSAYRYVERWGNRYGLVVFDECHHLPGASYQLTAVGAIAPFRLGLTATPERADAGEVVLPDLIGPFVYRREIKQLTGDFLAEYRVQRIDVDLGPDEAQRYQQSRETYRQFVEVNRIAMGSPDGWRRFLQLSCRSPQGRAAFQAYREQKRIAVAAPAKIDLLGELLYRHSEDRVIIFTSDNATAYQIARRFLVPIITHQTKARERTQILERFHAGTYPILVTSQVLNEGVDVPAANVGVVLSGTGSVREHVQRLGRLLRKHGEKQALLYEVVTRGTAEEFTSERRRQHHAYR